MKNVIYGIPTCGTVRKARKWLDEKGIEYGWVDLREKPPSKARLGRWVKTFGFKPMRNTSGGAYRALPPAKKEWGEREWKTAFEEDAMLLKRPVLEQDGKPVAVGFKPDVWSEIF
jgi:arsenate reductase